MASTHYDTLGLERAATTEQIRRAYHAEARRWHPDRYATAPAAKAAEAEEAMRRVNEAWRILGDGPRRSAYDRRLRGAPAAGQGVRVDDGVTRIDPRLLDPTFLAERRRAQEEEIDAGRAAVLRLVPWVGLIGVLAAIFVFTAYQTAGGADDVDITEFTVPGPEIGVDANACVRILAGGGLLEVPCDGARDGVVIGARLVDGVCPAGTVRESLVKPGVVACLAP